MTKYIVVCGGVISGVGKGVATASIAKILKKYGFKVTTVKIDPYINYDAGTLRPTEHGEVWVTDDGGEIDQDLGNYERFLGQDIPKKNNITTGQVYKTVIEKERKGGYLGKTVQVIPHLTDEIKQRIVDSGKDFDFCVVEIGGTIGDYENIPYLFAMKSLERELGKNSVIYILITYLPIPKHMGEMKTKPTQQAIRMLNEAAGIFPDFIVCRAPIPLDKIRKRKIERYANIPSENVISGPDVTNIYSIPLNFEKDKIGLKILKKLHLKAKNYPKWTTWKRLIERMDNPKKKVKIAIIGKYLDIGNFTLKDSYVSINQALLHAAAHYNVGLEVEWIDSKKFEGNKSSLKKLKKYKGIIIPGGFGSSGIKGKIRAIRFARKNNIPFLGLCYGLQIALIDYARDVCNIEDANSIEIDKNTKNPVINILPSQKELIQKKDYGGTMRLGAYAAELDENSKVFKLYKKTGRIDKDKQRIKALLKDKKQKFRLGLIKKGKQLVLERHRHRYEVSPSYIKMFEENGIKFSGHHTREDKTRLMEFIELPLHKYFVATQSHPEFKSRLEDPAPLFMGFVKACLE